MNRKDERGFAFVLVMVILLIISAVGASLVVRSRVNLRMSERSILLLKARAAAEAGAEKAYLSLVNGNLAFEDIPEGSENKELLANFAHISLGEGEYFDVYSYRLGNVVYFDSIGYVEDGSTKLARKRVRYVIRRVFGVPSYYYYNIFAGNNVEMHNVLGLSLFGETQKIHADNDLIMSNVFLIGSDIVFTYVNDLVKNNTFIWGPEFDRVSYVNFPHPMVNVNYWRNYIKGKSESGEKGFMYYNGDLNIRNSISRGDSIVVYHDSGNMTIPVNPDSKVYLFVDGNVNVSGIHLDTLYGSPELVLVSSGDVNLEENFGISISDASFTLMSGGSVSISKSGSISIGGGFSIVSNDVLTIEKLSNIGLGSRMTFASSSDVVINGEINVQVLSGGGSSVSPPEQFLGFELLGVIEK